MRISSYIKKLPFFSWMRGFIPNCVHLFYCSLFVLSIVFQSPYDTSLILWGTNIFCSWRGYFVEMCEYLYPIVQHFHLCGKKKTDRQTEKQTQIWESIVYTSRGGANIFCSWSGCLLEMSENLSPIVHSFHLCGKINRQTNRQTNKPLSFDCVHKPGGLIIFARGADIV